MNAAKRKGWRASLAVPLTRLTRPLTGGARPVVIVVTLAIGLVVGATVAWRKYGPQIVQDPRFQIDAERIEVTAQPPWIRADVKAEVVRDGSLGDLSLLDDQILKRIADAFAIHSWVAEVKGVRKSPTGVAVELVYRRPVAMVEVVSNGKPGLIPIDEQGVLLPTADFSQDQARDFLRVAITELKSYGPIGTPWQDLRVADAARIAAVWGDQWRELKLYRIVAVDDPQAILARPQPTYEYELQTRPGSRILWGHAPGAEQLDEGAAAEKIAALKSFVAEHGPLDADQKKLEIDVRSGSAVTVTPQTANLRRP